jgi:hypothetical protein
MRHSRTAGVCIAALALATTVVLGLPSAANAGTNRCTTVTGVGKTCIHSVKSGGTWVLNMTYTNKSNAPQNVVIYLYRDATPDKLKFTSQPDYDQPGQTTYTGLSVTPNGLSCGEPFYAVGQSYEQGATSYQDVLSPITISCQ